VAAIRTLLFLSVFAMLWSGCGGDDNPASPGPTTREVSGSITTHASWSGTVRLTADADIAAGVEITVAAGTVFVGAQDAVLRVHGSLTVNGTAAKPVGMNPVSGATSWGGIVVESGGVATIHHVTGSRVATLLTCKSGALACILDWAAFSDLGQALDASSVVTATNCDFGDMGTNAMVVNVGGDVTITDSFIFGAPADLVIVSGGKLTASYCEFGSSSSGAHDDIHVSSSTGVDISYSNIISAVYGISIGGTNGAMLQYNNFLNNDFDVASLGSNSAINMPNNYWDSGEPAGLGSEFVINNSSVAQIPGTGPRRQRNSFRAG
jgi:hypothetical protein